MISKIGQFLLYLLVVIVSAIARFLPYPVFYYSGKFIGWAGYYLFPSHRKRTLNNLSVAELLSLSEEEKKKIAIGSFQNLAITSLDYFYLSAQPERFKKLITCENPEVLDDLLKQGQGAVLLAAHQANWELPFLDLTLTRRGVAVGRPLKNKRLYQWVLALREAYLGQIVPPQKAISHGESVIKRGDFFIFVGDQALPESSYSYPLFGTRAWTSSAPALLAYKTGVPLVVIHIIRRGQHYSYLFSDPIYPNLENNFKDEVIAMMDCAMSLIESSIAAHLDQWLWQHNRWKQQADNPLPTAFRHDFILIILPPEPLEHIEKVKKILEHYPRGFITFAAPEPFKDQLPLAWQEQLILYQKPEALVNYKDPKLQLILSLYPSKLLKKHFLESGALHYSERLP